MILWSGSFIIYLRNAGTKKPESKTPELGDFQIIKKIKNYLKNFIAFCFCCVILISRIKEKITGKKGGAVKPRVKRPTGGITNSARYFASENNYHLDLKMRIICIRISDFSKLGNPNPF